MRSKTFVLDENIFLSHFIKGTDVELASYIFTNKLIVLSCIELQTELLRIINYSYLKKYKISGIVVKQFLENFTLSVAISYQKLYSR
jgi:predicted nucleic acid-binding protein